MTPPRASASPSMGLVRQVMANEVMAHELLLDPSFRLPEPPRDEDLLFYADEPLDEEAEAEEVATGSAVHSPPGIARCSEILRNGVGRR